MSRVFDKFPKNSKCILCGTNDDGKCTLLAIDGTEDGGNCQAAPVHVECLAKVEYRVNEDQQVVYGFYGG